MNIPKHENTNLNDLIGKRVGPHLCRYRVDCKRSAEPHDIPIPTATASRDSNQQLMGMAVTKAQPRMCRLSIGS
jgi:hypothetical protein